MEDEAKDAVGNISFSGNKDFEKLKKKNDVNEMVIAQLKKELEKYAFQLLKL